MEGKCADLKSSTIYLTTKHKLLNNIELTGHGHFLLDPIYNPQCIKNTLLLNLENKCMNKA